MKWYISTSAQIDPKHQPGDSIDRIDVVQGGEGPVPHMNVLMKNGQVAYIRLDKPEYADHHSDVSYRLNSKEKKDLQNRMDNAWDRHMVMSVKDGSSKIATRYEAAVDIWIDTYEGEDNFTFTDDRFPAPVNYLDLP